MRRTQAIGVVLLSGLSIGLGCQFIAGVDGTATFEPGNGGDGGTGGASTSSSSSSTGTGGVGGSGGSGGMGGTPECTKVADCIGNECKTAASCDKGVCVWSYTGTDVPLLSQLYGDCKTRKCDGSGKLIEEPNQLSNDTYQWDHPCYVNSCDAFPTPIPVPDTDMKQCSTAWGNLNGKCSAFKCVECTATKDCTFPAECNVNGQCVPMGCANGFKDGGETDIDCGGPSCPKCGDGKACLVATDCEVTCDMMMKCVGPSCSDGIQNGDETGMDCGGSCAKGMNPKGCPNGTPCLYPEDCESRVCKNAQCDIPTCNDRTQNQGETGVDCGGANCAECPSAP